jgi:hypothetical protein
MAVSDFLPRVPKWKCRIVTADPVANRVEVVLGDGAVRQVNTYNLPRWPVEGEIWTVYQENQEWNLAFRWQDDTEVFRGEHMQPGDMRLDSDAIYDASGNRLFVTRPDLNGIEQSNVSSSVGLFGTGGAHMGRSWTADDFAKIGTGLVGLWPLDGSGSDISGNGLHLTATTVAPVYGPDAFGNPLGALMCNQDANQASRYLYRLSSATDPLDIRTGSWGIKFRSSAKGRGSNYMFGKYASGIGGTYWMGLLNIGNDTLNGAATYRTTATTGAGISVNGGTFLSDNRWHIGIAVFDAGRLIVYVDGHPVGELAMATNGQLLSIPTAHFTIGGMGIAAANAAAQFQFTGMLDDAFVTRDVLSPGDVRFLSSAKVDHTLNERPRAVNISLTKSGPAPDYTDDIWTKIGATKPTRIYNMSGSNPYFDSGQSPNGPFPLTPAAGASPVQVNGPDGQPNGALIFESAAGTYATANDLNLPSSVGRRSIGFWIQLNSIPAQNGAIIQYGTVGTAGWPLLIYVRMSTDATPGAISLWNGAGDIISTLPLLDGKWHQVVFVMSAATTFGNDVVDSFQYRAYVDGRVHQVANATTTNTVLAQTATSFSIGRRQPVASSTEYINAALCRMFITSEELTGPQVAQLYALESSALGLITPLDTGRVTHVDEKSVYLLNSDLDPWGSLDVQVTR